MFESDQHAIVILKKDHKKVKELFDDFEDAERLQQKIKIAANVIKELKAHAAVEEEIFYPAVRHAVGDTIMNEAEEEHHVAKLLIAELEQMQGTEEHFEAKFKVLAESIRHHIKEEEGDMLPKAEDADLDFDVLGEELLARKEELFRNGFPTSPEEKLMSSGKRKKPRTAKTAKASRSKRGKAAAHRSYSNGHDHLDRLRT